MKKYVLLLLLVAPLSVSAHVKWFSDYDLSRPPRTIFDIFTNVQFSVIFAITSLIIFIVAYTDRELVCSNQKLRNVIDGITRRSQPYLPIVLRIGMGFFFLSLAVLGGTILTPELTTDMRSVSWLQIFLVLTLLTRKTSFLCGVGIIFLFSVAAQQYGLFHLMDYPVFLGIAGYLIIYSLFSDRNNKLALGILRVATASSLLWASVEKWAFPEWSFEILANKPGLMLGISSELYVVLAGFVEFCAAFLLLTGKVSAHAAALLLLFFCISAIPIFGVIDAIGHLGIIAALVVLLLSPNPLADSFDVRQDHRKTAIIHTCWFVVALLGYTFFFYSGYYLQYAETLAGDVVGWVQTCD